MRFFHLVGNFTEEDGTSLMMMVCLEASIRFSRQKFSLMYLFKTLIEAIFIAIMMILARKIHIDCFALAQNMFME